MASKKKLSQDGMIKNLIRDYPEDALEFFNPEIFKRYGRPTKINFHIQENKKNSHFDPKKINDIAIIYEFHNGKKVVLTLVEHWSDKSKFNIHRFAHYLIDLDYQFPDYEKLPVALFTDKADKWNSEPKKIIEIKCLNLIYLKFSYRLIRLKADDADKYRRTKNKFIAVLRSAMKWKSSKKVFMAFDFIKYYSILEEDVKLLQKHIDIIEYYFYLTNDQLSELIDLMNKGEKTGMLVQEIINRGIKKGETKGKIEGKIEGIIEGIIEGKLKDAKKMHEKGFSLKDILDITELTEEDLKKAEIL